MGEAAGRRAGARGAATHPGLRCAALSAPSSKSDTSPAGEKRGGGRETWREILLLTCRFLAVKKSSVIQRSFLFNRCPGGGWCSVSCAGRAL